MSLQPLQAHPDRTYAVLVGVDVYASPRLSPLNGPALDACRHAEWLLSKGVPAGNIRLLVSPGKESRDAVAAITGELGLVPRPATQAEVERVLVDELPEWHGDLLWFAWSGHGILDDEDQQRLFCADARSNYEVNLPMGEFERNLLHDQRYENIREKICIVDACREFDVPASSLPRTLSFGRTAPADSQAYLQSAYATQDGWFARNLGAEGRGLFTSHLLDELGRSPVWPPDLPKVLEAVKAGMNTAAVVQVPYLVERRRDGRRPMPFGSRARLSPHIRTHTDELARLRGKGYLTQDRLKFVSPRDGSDPRRLFRKLDGLTGSASEEESKRGVLLIGSAGAGKTRTCFEVAKAALQETEPWQVLHVGGSSDVSTDDVMAVVREQTGRHRVLLIFDYLDSYDSLNLQVLGEALRTEDPEGRVACIASARPGMLGRLRENGVGLLLDEVHLRRDREHTAEVIKQIFVDVAPGMLETPWGAERLVEACGQRPIIALLIARELESRLKAGLTEADLSPPRPNELLYWLQQRTKQDFGGPARETLMLASAVAAASCEQDQDAVESAVKRFLASWGDASFRDGPEGVVGRLLHLGWLVESGGGIDAIHDIVTDELLRMAVLPRGDTVRGDVVKKLLSAFLAGGRTFSLASRHLRRWEADLPETLRGTLEATCANWLVESTDQLGELITAEPNAGRAIVLTMLSGPPWRKGLDASWDRLVRPWLEETEHHDPAQAATVLTNAVRNSVGGVSVHLAEACLAWVDRQWTTRDVSQVLRALVEANGVSGRECDRAAQRVLRWLDQQRSLSKTGARLLAALLRRSDLDADRAVEVIDCCLLWVRRSKRNPDAGLVLRPLLLCKALDESRRAEAVKRSLAWLSAQAQPATTAPVLDAALRSENLPADTSDRVTRCALAWLKEYGGHMDASYVLEPLLVRSRPGTPDARTVCGHAFGWLRLHVLTRRATFVLASLLAREDLGARRAGPAMDAAVAWLGVHGTTGDAKFLFSSLLMRSDLGRDVAKQVAEAGVAWLARHGPDNGGGYVLDALLRENAVGGHVDSAAWTALNWLDETHDVDTARSVLVRVLECHGVGPDPVRAAVGRALDWLEANGREFEATYLLEPLLGRRRFLDGRAPRAVDCALDWLSRHGTRNDASFVLGPLLGLTGVADEEASAIELVTQQWLADHLPTEQARFVLSPLLRRSEFARDWPELVETLALAWLRLHGDHPGASFVIEPLLRRSDLNQWEGIVDPALAWLRENATSDGAAHVLAALTERRDTDLDQYGRFIDVLLAVLDAGAVPAATLLEGVRFRRDLDPRRAARLAEHALGLLEGGELPRDRGPLVGVLHLPLQPDQQRRAVDCAFRWLGGGADPVKKAAVLGALFRRDDLRPDQLAGVLESAEEWLERSGGKADAGRVLGPMLDNPDVGAPLRISAMRQALDWLVAHGTHTFACDVLTALFDAPDLSAEDGMTVAVHAEAWLRTTDSTNRRWQPVHEALSRYRER